MFDPQMTGNSNLPTCALCVLCCLVNPIACLGGLVALA